MPPYMGGTRIGLALRSVYRILANRPEGDRMIILISDGMSGDLSGQGDKIAADLRGADLRGADLRGAKLGGASLLGNLRRAIYNKLTKFPDGFDPETAWMMLVE